MTGRKGYLDFAAGARFNGLRSWSNLNYPRGNDHGSTTNDRACCVGRCGCVLLTVRRAGRAQGRLQRHPDAAGWQVARPRWRPSLPGGHHPRHVQHTRRARSRAFRRHHPFRRQGPLPLARPQRRSGRLEARGRGRGRPAGSAARSFPRTNLATASSTSSSPRPCRRGVATRAGVTAASCSSAATKSRCSTAFKT